MAEGSGPADASSGLALEKGKIVNLARIIGLGALCFSLPIGAALSAPDASARPASPPVPAASATPHLAAKPIVTKQTCLVTDYVYTIRRVKHGKAKWNVYRVNWKTYPTRTRVSKGTALRRSKSSRMRTTAGLNASLSAKYGENVILEKVEVKAKISGSYRRTSGSTSSESTTVRTQYTSTYPAGTTLITFKARKGITGTYQLSQCERQKGQSPRFGKVVWRTYHWSAYTKPTVGQWTCKLKADTTFELMAQRRVGCRGV